MCQFCHTPHIHDYPHCGYEMPPHHHHHHPHFHHPHPPVVQPIVQPNVVLKRPNVYNSVVAVNILKDIVTVLMDDGTYYCSPVDVVNDTREKDTTTNPTDTTDNTDTPNTNP